jgi:hypothetical protein
MLSTGKVMSYEDLKEARAKRAKQGDKSKVGKGKRTGGRKRVSLVQMLEPDVRAMGQTQAATQARWLNHIALLTIRLRRASGEHRPGGCGRK